MVSIQAPYNMINRHLSNDQEDFTLYPDPPQGVFGSSTMDLAITSESFPAYSRPAQDGFPTTTIAYDPSLFATDSYNYSRGSPGTVSFPEDAEMCAPSSNLSTASAASSAVGSPQSHPGQMAQQIPEWAAAHGLGVSPGIVGQNDYFHTGTEYSAFPTGMEEYYNAAATTTAGKPPPFVGELTQISTPRLSHVPNSSSISSVATGASRAPADASSENTKHLSLSSPVSTCSGASLVSFVSPTSASYSSPPLPNPASNWESASPKTPRVSPFFSQSSGHFVPPLHSSYPSLIHPEMAARQVPMFPEQYPQNSYPTSPPLSQPGSSPQPLMRAGSQSPFLHNGYPAFNSPYPQPIDNMRRQSFVSPGNFSEGTPYSGDETTKEKQRCPHPDCGKTFKDLKAHMLTHQNERPEKCPIQTCDYHIKGFARKYDKNRHTLTHYKGTMVCGFCPGSGSAAEKSFNRADVFKRHLTAVHGVEQTPPNSRKKASGAVAPGKQLAGYPPDATGKCSTCSQTFSNAQDFYEHLDDCVLRIVQQEDPAEAVNAKRLAEVEHDRDVMQTLEKNNLPLTTDASASANADEDDEDDEMAEDDVAEGKGLGSPSRKKIGGGNPTNGVQKSRGMTHSRGGVTLNVKKGRKNRRDYPSSWGFDKGQMTMKKRVLAVFDGPRRLAKDDMMLSTDHEVRIRLPDNKAYVTDLDVQTLKRAQGFHGATDEEKGPWISDDPTEDDLKKMREMLEASTKTAETPA